MNDAFFMKEALKLAEGALNAGEIPVGALLVRKGEIVGSGFNRRRLDGSPLAHAEILALLDASKKLKTWRFDDCTLYVTLEPCPMCAGAIAQCRIPRVVFGARDAKAGACGSLYDIPRDPRMAHRCQVKGGVLKHECAALLQTFFLAKRREKIDR